MYAIRSYYGDIAALLPGIEALSQELSFTLSDDGGKVKVGPSTTEDVLEVGLEEGNAYIRYGQKHQFFRGLGLLIQQGQTGRPFHIQENQQFGTIGPMFDLSRNGVLTVDSFKFFLRKMALMGLNTVMLYMRNNFV